MPHEVEFYRDLVRRPDFFRNAVHHLQLDQPAFRRSDPFGHLILATCTHLETLVLHELSGSSVATLLPRVQKLESLTHLHVHFTDLLSKLPRHERSAVLGAFSRLTHLELRERTPSEDVCAELAHLPRLTHLALKYDSQARGTSSACARVLQTCAALRVLAALSEKRVIFDSLISERYRAIDTSRMLDNDDPRFVLVTVERKSITARGWLSEVRAGRHPDFWERAEEAVERRKTA
jgi:hypothetical protein